MKALPKNRPKAYLVLLLGLGCALASGCQPGETASGRSTHDGQNSISIHRLEAPPSTEQALDLRVSDDMMQRTVGRQPSDGAEDFMSDKPILKLDKSRVEPTLKFSGELYYDEKGDEYLQSIEGGRLDIEIKFEG